MTRSIAQLRPAIVLLSLFTVLLGGAYPLFVKALVENGWNAQVGDSVIRDASGHILATPFDVSPHDEPRYFWGGIIRPEAADCYLGHRSFDADCQRQVMQRLALLKTGDATRPVPEDLTSFGTPGEMPRISPEAAAYQVHRIALARGLRDTDVSSLIQPSLHNPTYELTGAPYVNVLELNLRLDGKLK